MLRHIFLLLVLVFFVETVSAQSFAMHHVTYTLGEEGEIKLVDVDGDGKSDVVHREYSSFKFRWVKNNGNGQFGLSQELPASGVTNFFHSDFADMDQDGKPDLISLHQTIPSSFNVLGYRELVWQKNLGGGNFGVIQPIFALDSMPNMQLIFISKPLQIIDINQDGKQDFVVIGRDIAPGCIISDYMVILTSSPSGAYQISFGPTELGAVFGDNIPNPIQRNAFGDWIFLITPGFSSSDGFYVRGPSTPGIFGDFQLVMEQYLGTQNNQPVLTDVGNLTGDAISEVVCSYKMAYNTNEYKLGYFSFPPVGPANFHVMETGNGRFFSMHIADLNQDGFKDIVASRADQLIWYRNMGNGDFAPGILIENIAQFTSITSGDIDQDGDIDLVAYDKVQQRIMYLENGGVQSPFLYGNVYRDINANCLNDQYSNWPSPVFLKIMPGEFLTSSSIGGVFSKELTPGQYSVQLLQPPKAHVVDTVCGNPSLQFSLDSNQTSTQVDIGIQGSGCALLSVSATSTNRVPCRKTSTSIQISNQGLGVATSVTLRVKLPPMATYISQGSTNYTSYSFDAVHQEHVYTYAGIGGLGSLTQTIIDSNACNLQFLNQTFCTEARISYQGKCPLAAPGWDQSDLTVNGTCLSDGTASFEIKNKGAGSMADSSLYALISNAGITNIGSFKLDAGQSTWINIPNANQFLMLRVHQRPNHPNGPFTFAMTGNCLPNGSSPNLLLTANLGRESDDDKTTFCTRMRNSSDPNDKNVFPMGWGSMGNVPGGSQLQYVIRFQNTGTAPANYVQIRDTLSPHLDPASIRFIASSHQSRMFFSLEGTMDQPILLFTFPTIDLPDCNTSKEKSQGFVRYSISARQVLPQLTPIKNRASIIFDINEPIVTNQTINTINDSIPQANPLVLGIRQETAPLHFSIVPNPSFGVFRMVFPLPQSGELSIFDTWGKCLLNQPVSDQGIIPVTFPNRIAGIYLIRFNSSDHRTFQAKVVLE